MRFLSIEIDARFCGVTLGRDVLAPRYGEEIMHNEVRDAKTKPHASPNGLRTILLVDDDPVDLQFYRVILEHEGFKVKTSESFAAGVRLLEEEPFDMIVVGQGGEAFEGRSVLERAMEIDSRRPVAVMARRPDPNCYVEAMTLGAVDYRAKTTDAAEFVSVIEDHVGPPRLGVGRRLAAGARQIVPQR